MPARVGAAPTSATEDHELRVDELERARRADEDREAARAQRPAALLRPMRLRIVPAAAIILSLVGAVPAAAAPGDPYFDACFSRTAIPGCTQNIIGGAVDVEASPDGRSVYVNVFSPVVGIMVFDRAPNGSLARRPGTEGCITPSGGDCAVAANMGLGWDIALSPDGRNLYYSSESNGNLLVFDRDTATGVLRQKPGRAGCHGPMDTPTCTGRTGGSGAYAVVVSPERESVSVYLKTFAGLVVFDRDTTTGELTQKAGAAGCFHETTLAPCTLAKGLGFEGYRLALDPLGRHLYVPFTSPGGVAIFNRATDGTLTQVTPTAGGCISTDGSSSSVPGSCVDGSDALGQSLATAVDPTGEFVYVGGGQGIVVYRRHTGTGLLTQVECLRSTSTLGCKSATGVGTAVDFEFAPDGADLLISTLSGVISFFQRDTASGALAERAGPKHCMSGAGAPCELRQGLDAITHVALSPNGLDVYAASFDNGLVLVLERDFPPTCLSPTLPASASLALLVPLTCSDVNNDAITLEALTRPRAGTIGSIDQGADTIRYTPFSGFAGQDTFTYRGRARGVASAPATVTLNVAGRRAATPPAPDPDADADGFPASQDCDDTNPRIRPNAREIRGNGVDENCDGRLGLGRIRSVVRSDWRSFLDYTVIVGLRAARTPPGSRGEIRCRGKGCKFRRRAVQRRHRAIDFRKALPRRHRRFDVGQTIEVRITRRFHIGKVVRYPIRPRAVPNGRTLCLPVGSNRPRRRCR
jgi:DNA-binding beta-propeller fold protein YncE